MSLRFTLSEVAEGFVNTLVKEIQRPIARAATAAVREAGEIAKRNGRASIAAAGFSRKSMLPDWAWPLILFGAFALLKWFRSLTDRRAGEEH